MNLPAKIFNYRYSNESGDLIGILKPKIVILLFIKWFITHNNYFKLNIFYIVNIKYILMLM